MVCHEHRQASGNAMRVFSRAFSRPAIEGLWLAFFSTAVIAAPELSFRLDEGRNINSFTRDGAVAAHLLLRSGNEPRILVGFPAGNSGVGLWFAETKQPVTWTLVGAPKPITLNDVKGRPLHGIEAEAVVDAASLRTRGAVLSSIRVLRDYEAHVPAPNETFTAPVLKDKHITWARDRLDDTAGYRLDIEVLGDGKITSVPVPLARAIDANAPPSASIANTASVQIAGGTGGKLRLKITALTGEPPLTPMSATSLLTSPGRPAIEGLSSSSRSRQVLTYLSYREKYLAGSWRFDTYFGRDTLMSVMLLSPVLQPEAIERGIGAVLDRLAPNGEVAHEEDIGEFAILRNAKENRGRIPTPIYDYGMVDDDFMLAPLVAKELLDNSAGRARAAAFLATKHASGARTGDLLVRNFDWLVKRTAAFAADPVATKLVSIKDGRKTGQWRDSEEGLGRGRFPYDVNVALVPAALDAIDRLTQSKLLDGYANADQRGTLLKAGAQAKVWSQKAAPFFVVKIPADRAKAAISEYAKSVGVDSKAPLAAVQGATVDFNALSLDAAGKPIPVMNSDDGFVLLLTQPTPEQLERAAATASRPFPAGLATPVGMLVANPAFAATDAQARFTNTAYHGTVIWSWQQALMAAGLDKQLARTDLSPDLRAWLQSARATLWGAIDAAGQLRASELWTWTFDKGCYRAEAFGARRTDVDESNAAQLWSTVFLALSPPAGVKRADPCVH
jgi:hypothetical protein